MSSIHLTKKELNTRNGILDEIMNAMFDVSILVDNDAKIIHISDGSRLDISGTNAIKGQDISILDTTSPFREVLATGKSSTGMLLEIQGRKCISSIFPVVDKGEVIGAMGAIIFRDLKPVKRMFSQGGTSDDISELYSSISRIEGGYNFTDFIGKDSAVADLLEKAKKAAKSQLPVLIIGETGTGKEIIASAIHNSRFGEKHAPYVTINCTAIPENLLESELFGYEKGAFTGADTAKPGKFETASGGSILLDEIGDMHLQMQSKLLRVLESKEFERVGGSRIIPLQAGIIASTNQNLYMLSEEKKFRSDLYFRLNTIELFVPPLRHRQGDIPLLLNHFSEELEIELNISPDAMQMLTDYPWPGNVRQLKNLTQRLGIFYENKEITAEDIAKELRIGQKTYNEAFQISPTIKNSEKNTILTALKNNKNNISAAARELGISRGTLYNKIKKYNLLTK